MKYIKGIWMDNTIREKVKETRISRVLLSGEVFESAALFNDCLSKLLEDSVHVCALSRPQALKKTNMATVTGNEQGKVRILLHCLHWNGCKGNN